MNIIAKSSVDRKRSKYGDYVTLRFHKDIKTYHLTCSDTNPMLIAKFVETDGDLAVRLWELLENNYTENKQLKSVIGRLKRTIEEYEEQKENDSTISRNDFNNSEKDDEKNCGLCKHYNLDGMFGVWCDIHEIPTHDKYCSDFERNKR